MPGKNPSLDPEVVFAMLHAKQRPETAPPVRPAETPIGVRNVSVLDYQRPNGESGGVGGTDGARVPSCRIASQDTQMLAPGSRPGSSSPGSKPEKRSWRARTTAIIAIAAIAIACYEYKGQIGETLGIERYKDPAPASPLVPDFKADLTPKLSDDLKKRPLMPPTGQSEPKPIVSSVATPGNPASNATNASAGSQPSLVRPPPAPAEEQPSSGDEKPNPNPYAGFDLSSLTLLPQFANNLEGQEDYNCLAGLRQWCDDYQGDDKLSYPIIKDLVERGVIKMPPLK